MSNQAKRLSLECVDCHLKVKGERGHTLAEMRRHTKAAHGRDLVFGRDFYAKPKLTVTDRLASIWLLHPELALCC